MYINNKKGYSLAEVLVSITLIAVGLLSVVGVFPFALSHIRMLGERVFVVQQAQAKMEAFKGLTYDSLYNTMITTSPPQLGDTLKDPNGVVLKDSTYSYKAIISDPGFAEKVLQIKVEIYWNEKNAYGKSVVGKSYVLTGLVGDGAN